MDWNAVEAIAEIVGIVLVVVSLLFVGYQVRQNTQQLRSDNLLKSVRGTLDTNWYFHRDAEAFRVFRACCADFDGQSDHDRAHFHSILMDLSFYLEVVDRMHRSGLIDRNAVDINARFFCAVLDTPGGRQWWELAKDTRPMPDEAIESIRGMVEDPDREPEPITRLQPWFASADKKADQEPSSLE